MENGALGLPHDASDVYCTSAEILSFRYIPVTFIRYIIVFANQSPRAPPRSIGLGMQTLRSVFSINTHRPLPGSGISDDADGRGEAGWYDLPCEVSQSLAEIQRIVLDDYSWLMVPFYPTSIFNPVVRARSRAYLLLIQLWTNWCIVVSSWPNICDVTFGFPEGNVTCIGKITWRPTCIPINSIEFIDFNRFIFCKIDWIDSVPFTSELIGDWVNCFHKVGDWADWLWASGIGMTESMQLIQNILK